MSLLRLVTIACAAIALVCFCAMIKVGVGGDAWLVATLLAWLLDGSVASPAVGKSTP